MGYLHRVVPNKSTTAKIEGVYNDKGQMVDPNTGVVLEPGKIDRGHKYGYEERVMQKCAEKCHMTQKEYGRMMQNPNLYQWEHYSANRGGTYECTDYSVQLDKCFQVIREFREQEKSRIKDFQRDETSVQERGSTEKTGIRQGTEHSGQNPAGREGVSAPGHSGSGHGNSGDYGSTGGGHGGSGGGHDGTGGGHGR